MIDYPTISDLGPAKADFTNQETEVTVKKSLHRSYNKLNYNLVDDCEKVLEVKKKLVEDIYNFAKQSGLEYIIEDDLYSNDLDYFYFTGLDSNRKPTFIPCNIYKGISSLECDAYEYIDDLTNISR